MRIILSGGGTGGHIYPAIAIADAIKELEKGCEILFVGSAGGMESRLVPKSGYQIKGINCAGYQRGKIIENVKNAYVNMKGLAQADEMIEKFKPDGVIGTGGYVCYPTVRAAQKRGIYTALHESNAYAGLAVKLLSSHSQRIFLNFLSAGENIKDKTKIKVMGNPVRIEYERISREQIRRQILNGGEYKKLLLTFGGSLGARAINTAAMNIMDELTSKNSSIMHVHATGSREYGEFYNEYCRKGYDKCKNIVLKEYIYDMPGHMMAADLVICRCGAMTLTEIAFARRASILIPSPNVADDHQLKNALEFSKGGAALVVTEGDSEKMGKLGQYTESILLDDKIRGVMEESAARFYCNNCAKKIATDILNGIWIHRKNKSHRASGFSFL